MSDLKYNLFEDLKITHMKCKNYIVTPQEKNVQVHFPWGKWVNWLDDQGWNIF